MAADNNDWVIKLVFVVVAVVISMIKKASKGSPDRNTDPKGEADRERRFREALGLPPDAAAPPPVRGRVRRISGPTLLPVNPPNSGLPKPGQLRRAQPAPPPIPQPASAAQPAVQKVHIPTPPPPIPQPAMPVPPEPAWNAAKLPPERVTPPPAAMQAYSQKFSQEGLAERRNKRSGEVLDLLRRHSSARGAIILREVLGPPKALQS